jgi:gamma-glutamyl-gamma-aminobutyrate hydrolase PuuD
VLCHQVLLAPSSRLAAHLGCKTTLPVNSRHHQAVGAVAARLEAVAWDVQTATDGSCLIEAVEARAADRWVVGVQWHPESLTQLAGVAGDAARALFGAFAQALCEASAAGDRQFSRR